ncbi:hypothetical protein Tco_1039223 [Tanacetum coccineum]
MNEETEAQIMKIKETEIIKKIKNMIEAECLERMVVEIMRTKEEVLNIEKIKESDENKHIAMRLGRFYIKNETYEVFDKNA